jgi:hypothetical protein
MNSLSYPVQRAYDADEEILTEGENWCEHHICLYEHEHAAITNFAEILDEYI